MITLRKGKTTCPLLVVLHHSVRVLLFRVYWTPLSNQTEQLLSDKKQPNWSHKHAQSVEGFRLQAFVGAATFLPLLDHNSAGSGEV